MRKMGKEAEILMNYETWVESVSRSIADDTLLQAEAYRLALLVAELGWHDVGKQEDSPIYQVRAETLCGEPLPLANELATLLQATPLP